MSATEILKQAMKELPDDASMEQIVAFLEGEMQKRRAVEGAGGDSEEAAEAAASNEASSVAADDATAAETVEASDEIAASDVEDPAGNADAGFSDLAAQLGMSPEDLLAALMGNMEGLAALLSGESMGGTDPDMSAMGHLNEMAIKLGAELTAKEAQNTALQAEVAELKRENRLQKAVAAGHIVDSEVDGLRELGREAPQYFDKQLSAREENPKVPAKRKFSHDPEGNRGTKDVKQEISELSKHEKMFFDTYRALGRPKEEALRAAREKAAAAH